MKASKGQPSVAARPPAPPLKPTVRAEGAPGSSRPGLASDLGEATADFRVARSTQVNRLRGLPQEQATANVPPSKEELGATSWVLPLRLRDGSGSEQPTLETLRRCAQPPPARLPSQRLPLVQRLAVKSHPWLQVARGSLGNAHSPRYVLSRNSTVREAETARDKPPALPSQDKRQYAKRGLRAIAHLRRQARPSANGVPALCQNSDRVRQAPWASPSLERNSTAFLHRAVTASAFRLPGPAILGAAAIFPNRWGCLQRCIRNRGRFPHRSVQAEPRNRSPRKCLVEECPRPPAANRAARG